MVDIYENCVEQLRCTTEPIRSTTRTTTCMAPAIEQKRGPIINECKSSATPTQPTCSPIPSCLIQTSAERVCRRIGRRVAEATCNICSRAAPPIKLLLFISSSKSGNSLFCLIMIVAMQSIRTTSRRLNFARSPAKTTRDQLNRQQLARCALRSHLDKDKPAKKDKNSAISGPSSIQITRHKGEANLRLKNCTAGKRKNNFIRSVFYCTLHDASFRPEVT